MKNLALIAVVLAMTGCGGGNAAVTKSITPSPTSNPNPPPAPTPPAPTPPPPTPIPTPPVPTPPTPVTPPTPPTPQIVGKGINPQLNIVGNVPIVAFSVAGNSQTQVVNVVTQQTTTYTGFLNDLEAGQALTETYDPQGIAQNSLYVNGSFLTFAMSNGSALLQGQSAVWISGNSLFTSSQSAPPYTANGQILEFTISGSLIAYVAEVGPVCDVYVNGVQVSHEGQECAQDVKIVSANGQIYVGWDDSKTLYYSTSLDGQVWGPSQIFGTSGIGVIGQTFIVRPDGSIKFAWTQEMEDEDGSSVWAWDNGAGPTRLSAPVKPGFSGAGNPAIAQDGSVVWLDDSQGTAAGDFAVVLDGQTLTSDPSVANDEGPAIGVLEDGTRVIVWGDEVNTWEEEVQ